ncbi:unnamed protein product [Rotaria sp. Silwood1]|nr:unnamed protein product [Rotaria sp. Silwood1]CAF4668387.1 unnamed protein product [Rotaria sp. Silwood1]
MLVVRSFFILLFVILFVGVLILDWYFADTTPWSHYESSTQQSINGVPFCEHDRPRNFLRERANSLSDFSFLGVGFYMLVQSIETKSNSFTKTIILSVINGLINCVHAFGSWLNHACRCQFGHRLDVTGMWLVTSALSNEDDEMKARACETLGNMHENAAVTEVIHALASTLNIQNHDNLSENAATVDVIQALLAALRNGDRRTQENACKALGKLGEKVAIDEIIKALIAAVANEDENVKDNACRALGSMGKKAATDGMIKVFVAQLGYLNFDFEYLAQDALANLSKITGTNPVIEELLIAIANADTGIRESACFTLDMIGEQVATSEVTEALTIVLKDDCDGVKSAASKIERKSSNG